MAYNQIRYIDYRAELTSKQSSERLGYINGLGPVFGFGTVNEVYVDTTTNTMTVTPPTNPVRYITNETNQEGDSLIGAFITPDGILTVITGDSLEVSTFVGSGTGGYMLVARHQWGGVVGGTSTTFRVISTSLVLNPNDVGTTYTMSTILNTLTSDADFDRTIDVALVYFRSAAQAANRVVIPFYDYQWPVSKNPTTIEWANVLTSITQVQTNLDNEISTLESEITDVQTDLTTVQDRLNNLFIPTLGYKWASFRYLISVTITGGNTVSVSSPTIPYICNLNSTPNPMNCNVNNTNYTLIIVAPNLGGGGFAYGSQQNSLWLNSSQSVNWPQWVLCVTNHATGMLVWLDQSKFPTDTTTFQLGIEMSGFCFIGA